MVASLLMNDVRGLSEFEPTLNALKELWPDTTFDASDKFRYVLPRCLLFAYELVRDDVRLMGTDAGIASLVSLSRRFEGVLIPDEHGRMLTEEEWLSFEVGDDQVLAIIDGICQCSPTIRRRILYNNRIMPGIHSTVTTYARKAEERGLQVDFCLPSGEYGHTGLTRPMAVLAGLPIIDASSATWDQILEVRRDPESMQKLRKLRVFTQQQFTGKDLASIEDEFGQLMDEYQTAAKRYDFNIKTHHLGVMMAATATSVGLLAAVAGMPNPLIALAPGIPFAFAGLQMYRYDVQIRFKLEDHAAAYIFDTEHQLRANSQATGNLPR